MNRSWLLAALVTCWCAALSAQPVGISYIYGSGQMGPQLNTIAPIVVFVYDKDAKPVANSAVTWTVTQGASAAITQTTVSDANGYAMSYLPAYAVDSSSSFLTVEVDARGLAGGPVKFFFTSLATGFTTEVLKPGEDQDRTLNTTAGALERAAYQVAIMAADGSQTGLPIPNVGLRVLNVMPGLNQSGYYDFKVGNDPRLPSATCVNNTLSDANGIATCDLQTGPRAGTTRLYVLLGENRLMQLLTLNVAIGAAAALSLNTGSGQRGGPGERLAVPLSVHATDAGGNATPNAAVAWSVIAGAASLAGNSSSTDARGDAMNTVTLGSTPGPVRVRATLNSGASVDFELAVVLGVSSLQVVSGDDQSALIGATFSNALVVRAMDAAGAPVVGVPVKFSITNGGSLSAAEVVANTSGIASVFATAGANPGPLTVTATAQGFPVVFQKLIAYAPGPLVTAVRNAASRESGLTPCGLATVTGVGLATGVDGVIRSLEWDATRLGPVDSVLIGGVAALLRGVSNVEGREEIAIQTPCAVGAGSLEVAVSVLSITGSPVKVEVKTFQPGVFEVDDNGQKIGWAAHGDGSTVNSVSPAGRGEVIRIFATGLGPFASVQNSGEQILSTELVLGINDSGVPLVGSGYLTNQPGLYFVEVAIPVDFPTGPSNARFVVAIPQLGPQPGNATIYSNTVAIPVR